MKTNKICNICKQSKNISEFHRDKTKKDGFKKNCKICRKKESSKYYKNNISKIKVQQKKYYLENKEEYYKRNKKHKENNNAKIKEYFKKYNKKNRKKINEYKKIWEYNKNKNSKNRLSKNISVSIRQSLKGKKNNHHWEDLVGYTINELIEHLENISDFTIQDYLEKDLHLDHIIPQSLYNFNSFEDEEFKKCWNKKNLRIIEAEENLLKHNKLDMELIEEYGIKDLIPVGK